MSSDAAFPIAEFPPKLEFLFEPKRYKVLYGGRGGAKSWGVGRALLVLGARTKLRILCARELQISIKDSVHKLLSDQIAALGLDGFYEVTQAAIRGANGTEFAFAGLRSNIAQIKSFEGINICWVEEAQTVSKSSWDVLIPTIREEGSEIWISFNPDLAEDETYKRFVLNQPKNGTVVKVGWQDNPWFPQVLAEERDDLEVRDHNSYLNVWEGQCRSSVDGAIFGNEMMIADGEGRITSVPCDKTKPVHRIWDLGWADNVAIWFLQMVGLEYRLIRYIEGNHKTISDFLAECQKFGYVYDTDWMPHDVENEQLAANGKSIKDIMLAAGCKVRVLPKVPVVDSINAARTIFNTAWFDRENCADGLQCLRHYQYEVDPDTNHRKKTPLHNNYSHGADAFRMIGLMVSEPRKQKKKAQRDESIGWMG